VEKRIELYVSCSKALEQLIIEHKPLINRSIILSNLNFSSTEQMGLIHVGDEEVLVGIS
jgi:isoleucyl-tRNA synthetase